VVIRYPPDRRQLFIKRIVAGPGDRIRIRDKRLLRNGEPVAEPYAVHATAGIDAFRDNFPAAPTVRIASQARDMLQYHVEGGELLIRRKVLRPGDNRDDSLTAATGASLPAMTSSARRW
jgi:signal peptidase I